MLGGTISTAVTNPDGFTYAFSVVSDSDTGTESSETLNKDTFTLIAL